MNKEKIAEEVSKNIKTVKVIDENNYDSFVKYMMNGYRLDFTKCSDELMDNIVTHFYTYVRHNSLIFIDDIADGLSTKLKREYKQYIMEVMAFIFNRLNSYKKKIEYVILVLARCNIYNEILPHYLILFNVSIEDVLIRVLEMGAEKWKRLSYISTLRKNNGSGGSRYVSHTSFISFILHSKTIHKKETKELLLQNNVIQNILNNPNAVPNNPQIYYDLMCFKLDKGDRLTKNVLFNYLQLLQTRSYGDILCYTSQFIDLHKRIPDNLTLNDLIDYCEKKEFTETTLINYIIPYLIGELNFEKSQIPKLLDVFTSSKNTSDKFIIQSILSKHYPLSYLNVNLDEVKKSFYFAKKRFPGAQTHMFLKELDEILDGKEDEYFDNIRQFK